MSNIWIKVEHIYPAAEVLGFLIVQQVKDGRFCVALGPLQKRELIRKGISFTYRKED